MNRVSSSLLIVTMLVPFAADVVAVQAKSAKTAQGHDSAAVALRHAEALAASRVEQWARLDLGCLARARAAVTAPGSSSSQLCWDETMKAHVALTEDEPEKGVLGPGGGAEDLGC